MPLSSRYLNPPEKCTAGACPNRVVALTRGISRNIASKQASKRVRIWLIIGICHAAPAVAHDVWLAQATPPPTASGEVRVELFIGEHGKREPMIFAPERIERLWLTTTEGVREFALGGPQSALEIADHASGARALAYISKPAASVLPAPKFDDYLREEHLLAVLASRHALSAEAAMVPPSERYSRSLKLVLDDPKLAIADCPVGLPLELSVRAADAKHVTVLATFRSQPLAGVWVDRADADGRVLAEGMTDANGEWVVPRTDGDWILRTTHMLASEGDGAAWRSWWATTSFRLNANGVKTCPVARR